MPPLSRHKNRTPSTEGAPGLESHEPVTTATDSLSPNSDEDPLVGPLTALDAHRDAIIADMPHDGEAPELLPAPSPRQTRTADHQREWSPERSEQKSRNARAVSPSSRSSHRRKPLTTDHEDGGGGSAGATGQKRGPSALSFRKRVGKSSPFGSLVMPDESILDYLVSTVARWLERLRDKVIRALSPGRPPQKGKNTETSDDGNATAPTGAGTRQSRKRARRAQQRTPHRRQ